MFPPWQYKVQTLEISNIMPEGLELAEPHPYDDEPDGRPLDCSLVLAQINKNGGKSFYVQLEFFACS